MEINVKVSVEGVVRDVCGVNEATTCEEVIFKLAQAACLPGFYTLVAKHYAGETTLAPEEKLVTFIRNLGEKPGNIHFVLCRLEAQAMHTNVTRARTQQQQQTRTGKKILAGQSQQETRTASHRQLTSSYTPSLSKTAAGAAEFPHTVALSHEATGCLSPGSLAGIGTDSKSATQVTRDLRGDALSDNAQYAQLEDQLASQEHEVELNRIRLLQLDKTIESLEHSNRTATDGPSALSVGPAAELAQLTATPWPQLLEANRARQLNLIRERERYQMAIDRLDSQLVSAQSNVAGRNEDVSTCCSLNNVDEATQMETQLSQELQLLLSNLESVNAHRRRLLHSLSPSSRSGRGRTLSAKDVDGVAV